MSETSEKEEKPVTVETGASADVDIDAVGEKGDHTPVSTPAAPAIKVEDTTVDSPPPPTPPKPNRTFSSSSTSSSSPSASRSRSRSPSPSPLRTPAPLPHSSTPLVPDAPPPKPIPKDLPAQTPASAHTPAPAPVGGGSGVTDISEFDPFATPSAPPPAAAGPSHQHSSVSDNTPGPAPGAGNAAGASSDPETPRAARRRRTEDEPVLTPEAATAAGGPGGSGSGSGSGEPAFNFSGFLKDIKSKPADPIARYLKSFLTNFAKKPFTVNEQIKLIHDFLAFIGDKMAGCEPWKSQSPAEMDNALEAMEKLVMNRLYNYTFTPQLVPSQPITTDDLERDAVFSQRVRLFGWVRERHLDVPESEAAQGFLGFAEQELLKINHYKAPRDKMICILNCCKVIFGLLRHASNGSEDTSADAFVPILIFVVLQANPDNLISNIEYINRFRNSSRLTGEAGYYLSSLSGAIQFIETMDSTSLSNITQTEFEDAVSAAVADLPPSPTSSSRRHAMAMADADADASPSPFSPTAPGEEPARALAMLGGLTADPASSTRKFFQRTGEVVSKPLSAIGKILEGMQGEEDEQRQQQQQQREQGERRVAPEPRRRAVRREQTPESPSQRLSQLGISDSLPASGANTPQREVPVPDFTFSPAHIQEGVEASQETYDQTRRANVQTLHQMFPQLEEEIVEAVLEGCNEDLGLAIDRLLEM